MSQARKLPRRRVFWALLACGCLAFALASSGARAQQPSGANTPQPAKQRTKRITPLKSADAGQGSRVTITSDSDLNDYRAYRSGDRFVVIIPQAQGGDNAGARGRGFEGAQVSRRGDDLVYTFKLEPGATAKVNQRFNRLDVQFTATKQAQANENNSPAPSSATTPRTAAELSGIKSTPTPAATPTPARTNAVTGQTPGVGVPPVTGATTNPNEVSPSFSVTPSPATTPSVMPSASPALAPSATPELIAQAQPTAAPISVVAPSTAVATTSTLGATVARNWYWIIAALFVVGVGFLFVSRFGERRTAAPPPASDLTATKPALNETTTAKLAPSANATEKIAAATTAATLASAAQPATFKSKKGKKNKKNRAAQTLAEPAETAKSVAAESGAATPITSTPTETKLGEATAAAGIVAASLAASKLAGTKGVEKKEDLIAPVSAADAERVGTEMKKLLAGEAYDESVVGATDPATRELVASELLAALSSRNVERNERARAAFLKHKYFEDAARDLQSAQAPAQRASAAHALSLLHERAATPHLVAALDDPSADVRRASVEALAALKDPTALEPLEGLRWRETSRLVPRSLIQHAVEACTPSDEETKTIQLREPGVVAAPEPVSAPAPAPVTETTENPTEAAEAAAPAVVTEKAQSIAGVEVPVATSDAAATAPQVAAQDETHAVAEEKTLIEESVLAVPPVELTADAEAPLGEFSNELDETTLAVESPSASSTVEAAEPAAASHDVAARPDTDLTLPGEEVALGGAHATALAATVYSFDENEGAKWPSRHSEDETLQARRGTGGLEFKSQTAPDTVASARDEAAESPIYVAPEFAVASSPKVADDWLDVDVEEQHLSADAVLPHAEPTPHPLPPPVPFERTREEPAPPAEGMSAAPVEPATPLDPGAEAPAATTPTRDITPHVGREDAGVTLAQKGIEVSGAFADEDVSIIPQAIQVRLESEDAAERAESVRALARLNTDEAFYQICAAFDDPAVEVRNAAARAVYEITDDRADSFTRALRESPAERRRRIGASLATSGLADEAVSHLTGESREKTYDAFSLLFLMAKAGENTPLIRAIESHPDAEVRLAVVKLLALSGQQEVLPAFKRLAVRGSLPAEVRSAVMEAIYQISSAGTQSQTPKPTRTA
ncbi:MAG: HEAT repeat domain-containing protein [Pyrinomonadaceae bacterium]